MNTAPKLILATVAVVAGMAAAWAPMLGPWTVYLGFITLGFVVMLGMPTFLVLRDKKKLNGFTLAAAGCACAAGPVFLVGLSNGAAFHNPLQPLLTMLAFISAMGIGSALVFGVVWNLLSAREDRFPWLPAKDSKT